MEKSKIALITGITGQDGSYLSELLLKKGYEVHGIVRRVALEDPSYRLRRINHIKNKLNIHSGSIENYSRISEILDKVKPDECYHLASQSFVYESFEDSFSTFSINIEGTLNVLNSLYKKCPKCKFYFAGSSEMFGKVLEIPQTEKTPFYPRSPYGISKVAGFDITRNFREAYNIFACSGILYNHESPRRGFEFVTRKITNGISKMKKGLDNTLLLGNLDAKRDWGYSKDYVKAQWLMLQQKVPDDYVISSGENHSIRDFLDLSFKYANMKYKIFDLHSLSTKEADREIKKLKKQRNNGIVIQYPTFYRPAEVHELLGDSFKAKKELGWKSKTSFHQLVRMMVEHDLTSS